MKIKANYTPVNESLAKTAKHMNSFSDYREGSATHEQKYYTDSIVEYAELLLKNNPTDDAEKIQKIQGYVDRYSKQVAEAIDKNNAIRSRCPSILIAGAGNFPTAKKEKQNAASFSHWEKTRHLFERTAGKNHFYDKIRKILTNSGAIMSDDKDAVQKIKDKIERLQVAPDPYGNNAAEIRRLKGRLLALAPDEVKQGKEITINGQPATFENIVKIFNDYAPSLSPYDTENERYYLNIPLTFSDGKRKYTALVSSQVNKDATEYAARGDAESNYQPIWKPLTDRVKFLLVIREVNGSGNKAVIFSILRDLDPELIEKKKEQQAREERGEQKEAETITINGETAQVIRNAEAVRLQLIFEGKPEAETRAALKSNGFKWAPSQNAWQRLLNSNAENSLKKLAN